MSAAHEGAPDAPRSPWPRIPRAHRCATRIAVRLLWLRRCLQIAGERYALRADEAWIRELEFNRATHTAHYAESCAQRDARRVRIALLERARDNLRKAMP